MRLLYLFLLFLFLSFTFFINYYNCVDVSFNLINIISFRPDAAEIKGAIGLVHIHPSGPQLFDELMKEMSDDVLEISSASARRLYNSIAEGMEGYNNTTLKPILSLAGLVPDNSEAMSNELIASRVAVGETTGFCPRSGVKLQLIKLEKDQRKQLHNSLIQLAKTRFEEFAGNDQDANYAAEHLNSFAEWLKYVLACRFSTCCFQYYSSFHLTFLLLLIYFNS